MLVALACNQGAAGSYTAQLQTKSTHYTTADWLCNETCLAWGLSSK